MVGGQSEDCRYVSGFGRVGISFMQKANSAVSKHPCHVVDVLGVENVFRIYIVAYLKCMKLSRMAPIYASGMRNERTKPRSKSHRPQTHRL